MRLNKYLSDAGVCSRREADRLVEAGRITINGETAGWECRCQMKRKSALMERNHP